MEKQEAITLFSELITKIYNSTDLTDDLLDEIEEDLKKIDDLLPRKQYYRELIVFLDKARDVENLISRNNYKFLFLSDLESRLNMLKRLEE